jgi:hypothetical protein
MIIMAKQSGMMKMVDMIVAQREEEIRAHSRLFMLDMVTLALGRMGHGEKFFLKFDQKLTEVCDEYSTDILDDAKVDKDLDYSKSLLDRELKQYVGKLFIPYDERYHVGVFK